MSVRLNKGKNRPIDKLKVRYQNVLKNIDVDYCVSFEDKTPLKKIRKIRPNIIFKGSDYKKNDVVGYSFVKAIKGKVNIIKRYKNFSTTKKIKDNKLIA